MNEILGEIGQSGLAKQRLPLEGLRVTSLEHSVAAPLCTRMLADLGASVVKIERPGSGDFGRHWDSAVQGLSSYFVWLNRNKRSMTLNLKTEQGKKILHTLLSKSDVFVQNLGPGGAEKLGFGPEAIRKEYPNLIYCSISGYGRDGPYRDEKAYDLLIQGESGLISLTGYEDKPAKVGVSISDISSGLYSAIAVLSALRRRDASGNGAFIDMSMFDCMLDIVAGPALYFLYTGKSLRREGMRHNIIVPYGPFIAKDGKYVSFAVENQDEWKTFCNEVICRPDLVEDSRFISNERRLKNRRILEPIIESVFLSKSAKEWSRKFHEVEIACGRVNNLSEVVSHPQLKYRGLMQKLTTEKGAISNIGNPIRIDGARPKMTRLPSLGEDTREVLKELGIVAKVRVSINKDIEKAKDALKKVVTFYSLAAHYRDMLAEMGLQKEIAEIQENYKKSGFKAAAKAVSDDMLTRIPVVPATSMKDLKQGLKKYDTCGATRILVAYVPSTETSTQETIDFISQW